MSASEISAEFRAAMQAHGKGAGVHCRTLTAHGLIPPEHIQADGEIHRCDAEGPSGKGDGSYLRHLDGIPAGGFQIWKNGGGWIHWWSREARTLTQDERARLRATLENVRRQRAEDRQRRHNEAAAEAVELWNAARPAPPDHPYLTGKGVQPHALRLYQGPRHIPAPPPAIIAKDGARTRTLDLVVELRLLWRDAHALREAAVRCEGNDERITNPRLYDLSLVARLKLIAMEATTRRELWELQRMEAFYNAIIEAIADEAPDCARPFQARLADLNQHLGMTHAEDQST